MDFHYNKQIKRYLVQFMHLFTGMEVEVGATSSRPAGRISVPVHYSSMDKVAASVKAGGTSNMPLRLPVMSVDLVGIRQNTQYVAGLNQVHSQTYLPQDGFYASDTKTLSRLRPAAYILDLDLAIWTSNDDQHFQVLEQILCVFNPSVQLQVSDSRFDWTKISLATLTNMRFNSNYPIGTANRTVVTNLAFELPIYLSAPADVKEEFVKKVQIRLAALGADESFDDILGLFDEKGMGYENLASVDEIVEKAGLNKDE